jgi:hypothetical protein
MALTSAARQTVKMISGFAPDAIIMTAHGINHMEKALLIAQRFGKLSASIAAYRTAVRLRPLSETGQTRTSSLKADVRFRRVQTLVRGGNPLVKLRNSA